MTVLKFVSRDRQAVLADLQTGLIGYRERVAELRSPDAVLNELHAITTRDLPLPVLGAARFPQKPADWESVQLGRSAFLHESVPDGWWEEYDTLARGKFRPMLYLAASSMAMHT